MATTVEIPRKLIDDVTYVLRYETESNAGPQHELADKIERFATRSRKTGVCDARRTAVDGAIHKGLHACGLKDGHKDQHQCGRTQGDQECRATWRKLVRAPQAE